MFFIIAYFGTNRDSCPERQEFFYTNLHNSYAKRTNIVYNKQESLATNKSFMMQIMVMLNECRLYRTKKVLDSLPTLEYTNLVEKGSGL